MESKSNLYQFREAPSFVRQDLPLYTPSERHRWMAKALYQRRVIQGLDSKNPTDYYRSLLSDFVSFGNVTRIYEIISDTAFGHEPLWNGFQITEQSRGSSADDFILDEDTLSNLRMIVQNNRREWLEGEDINLYSTQLDLGQFFHSPVLFLVYQKKVAFYDYSTQSWQPLSESWEKHLFTKLPFKSVMREDGSLDRDTVDLIAKSLRQQCEQVLWKTFFNKQEHDPNTLSMFRLQSSINRVIGVWALHLYTSSNVGLGIHPVPINMTKDKAVDLMRPPAACFRDISGAILRDNKEETERHEAALTFLKCLGFTDEELSSRVTKMGQYIQDFKERDLLEPHLQLLYNYEDFPRELIARYRHILRLAAIYRFSPNSNPETFEYSIEHDVSKQVIVTAIEFVFAGKKLIEEKVYSHDLDKSNIYAYYSLKHDVVNLLEKEALLLCESLDNVLVDKVQSNVEESGVNSEFKELFDYLSLISVNQEKDNSTYFKKLFGSISLALFKIITTEAPENSRELQLVVIYYRLFVAGLRFYDLLGIEGGDTKSQELANKALERNSEESHELYASFLGNSNISVLVNKWLNHVYDNDLDITSCWLLLVALGLVEVGR